TPPDHTVRGRSAVRTFCGPGAVVRVLCGPGAAVRVHRIPGSSVSSALSGGAQHTLAGGFRTGRVISAPRAR
ncbi:hypothetical protein, partial [Pseudonocardia sulfidoxydans]|uniref:hypothetical protein n=1 Tax=Pseudonocardia sulfidoxydans TaxID=54011 RepID=UPI001C99A5FA